MNKFEYVKKSVHSRVEWCKTFKNHPCKDCGGKYPSYVMDWHHRNSDDKVAAIGRMAYRYSKKRLLEEMAKCDLVCANCHRIRHHKENTPL